MESVLQAAGPGAGAMSARSVMPRRSLPGTPGPASPTPYTCKQGRRCPVYQAIRVEAADVHGVHRITFHGTYVGTSAPFNAAVTVLGLHAGAHIEAQRWRWAAPEGMEP